MKRTIIILTLALTAASCGGRRGAKGSGDGADSLAATGITYPFTIDVSQEYPMEPVSFQEVFGEMEYVALETTPDCLIGDYPGLRKPFVTDSDIIICSGRTIFRFGRDGKFLNNIGSEGRGPGEFLAPGEICVNDTTKEVFVYDILGKCILVYGYDGHHKRTLRTSNKTIIGDMAVMTDSTLLIANKTGDSDNKELVIYPFQLISTRDGSVVRTLLPPYDDPKAEIVSDRAPAREVDPTKGFHTMMMVIANMLPGGGMSVEIVENSLLYVTPSGVSMTAFVADTVYSTSAQGVLSPKWIKSPSPMGLDLNQRRYSTLTLDGDRYAMFFAYGNERGMGYKVDKTTGTVTRAYVYDANVDHLSTRDNRQINPYGIHTGRFAMAYQPLKLLDWMEQGKLTGELATLAATLKETDNPVLLIQK